MAEGKKIKIGKSNPRKGEGTILIVDDEISIRRVLQEFLHLKGFDTHGASSAEMGLEILNKIRVDLVITNIWMPGMDGLEFTRLIKAAYDSDVIIVTGCHGYSYEEALRIGADALFYKPVKLKDLLNSINRVFNE